MITENSQCLTPTSLTRQPYAGKMEARAWEYEYVKALLMPHGAGEKIKDWNSTEQEKDMKIRPIPFSDELFYWLRTGKQPTVLEVQCTLVERVVPHALKTALGSALRVHTNFRIRPVIVRGTFQAVVCDVKNPPLFREDGCVRHLGKAETSELMLYVSYGEKNFTLHIFHGLSDFRGICAFMNTILKFYFHELGQSGIKLPEPDSRDAIPCFENILEAGAPGDPIGMFDPKEHDIFTIPEKNFGKKTTMQHICEIDVPLDPLLALSRANESSVVPTIEAFIGRAIRNTYEVGEKIITGYTPIDLRPVFHFENSGNSSSNFPIPYTEKMNRYALNERSMYLRSILDIQSQPENLYVKVKYARDAIMAVAEKRLPLGLKARIITNGGRKMDREIYTYGISYAGKVRFGEEIDPHVASVTACAGSYSYPLWILACEFGGIIRMVLTQSYESETLARNICKEMAGYIPGISFIDWGHHEFDEFYLKDLRRLRKTDEG